MNNSFWHDRKVFITGHTGFKGSWLSLWLINMGAEVHGYALSPPTEPNFFTIANLTKKFASHTVADVRDANRLALTMQQVQPEVVFHLAAQPLVRHSYVAPVDTYAINVMGTVYLLEAARTTPSVRAVVNITSDKCYENREWPWPYREIEAMGGFDPYSSSKGCAELVSAAYRRSYLARQNVQVATARAGNVIGGGDWAQDRLLPDFFRAVEANVSLSIRSPNAIRPWQYVLEPLAGYLRLAEKLYTDGELYAEAWNFGPYDADAKSVSWIIEKLGKLVPKARWECNQIGHSHEANLLKLDCNKARAKLGWQPRWDINTALMQTVAWYDAWRQGADMAVFSLEQIHQYEIAS